MKPPVQPTSPHMPQSSTRSSQKPVKLTITNRNHNHPSSNISDSSITESPGEYEREKEVVLQPPKDPKGKSVAINQPSHNPPGEPNEALVGQESVLSDEKNILAPFDVTYPDRTLSRREQVHS